VKAAPSAVSADRRLGIAAGDSAPRDDGRIAGLPLVCCDTAP
jgi:hypothetical protein